MLTLRSVAAGGRVVLASLHQPSRDMFLSLDRAVLMAHGRVLYTGPPAEAESWFAAAGLPCPPGTAVAEHMLKVCTLWWGRVEGGAGGPCLLSVQWLRSRPRIWPLIRLPDDASD